MFSAPRGAMKYSYQIFLLTTGLLILMVMKEPSLFQNFPVSKRQMMEEIVENKKGRYQIRFEIHNPKESEIADILWLQKVARFTLNQGVTGFNVLEEKITPFAVEGVIEFEPDRMEADYDSYEILELELPEI
jgi:hypothetical protein